MELVFRILAVILAGVAAFFLWKRNGDGAFISAVLGAVSFFLSIRFQVKERLKKREEERMRREDEQNSLPDPIADDFVSNDQIDEQRTTDNEQKANL